MLLSSGIKPAGADCRSAPRLVQTGLCSIADPKKSELISLGGCYRTAFLFCMGKEFRMVECEGEFRGCGLLGGSRTQWLLGSTSW